MIDDVLEELCPLADEDETYEECEERTQEEFDAILTTITLYVPDPPIDCPDLPHNAPPIVITHMEELEQLKEDIIYYQTYLTWLEDTLDDDCDGLAQSFWDIIETNEPVRDGIVTNIEDELLTGLEHYKEGFE